MYLPNLISFYQSILTTAIQQGKFGEWEASNVCPRLQHSQREVNDWTDKASSFFSNPSVEPLAISLPASPEVLLPEQPNQQSPERTSSTLEGLTPGLIATGLGWVFGGPLGAVVAGSATTIASKLSGDRPLSTIQQAKLSALEQSLADILFSSSI